MSDLYKRLQQYDKSQDAKRPTGGTVKRIDGDYVDILVRGSSTILRQVKCVGQALTIGQTVTLSWQNGVPTAQILGGIGKADITALTQGPQGPQGEQGPAGANGADGAPGATGPAGSWTEAAYAQLTEQASTPSNPPAGSMRFYAKTDEKFYGLTPGGVERPFVTGMLGWEYISEVELTAGDGALSLTSIPQTFRHLKIFIMTRSNVANNSDPVMLKFNNDAGNNYVGAVQWGGATPGISQRGTAGGPWHCTYTTGTTSPAGWFNGCELTIGNYAKTTMTKWWQARGTQVYNLGASLWIYDGTGMYLSTSAITQVDFYPGVGTAWKQYSVATLYGLK